MKRPAIWALVFLICGIAVVSADLPFALFFVGAVAASAVLYRACGYWPVVLFAAFFVVGAWRVTDSLHSHTTEAFHGEFSGRVLDIGITSGGNQRATIRGEHPQTGAAVRIMAYIRPFQRQLLLGQEVTLSGEFQPLNRPLNPGGFDQFQHLRSQGIDATIWPENIAAGEVNPSLMVVLRQFRERLSAVYDGILPPREAGIVKSMILGDRVDLDRDLAYIYRTMGIFHILSISGLHVTILMVAASKFFGIFLQERRVSIVVLALAVLYCLMTGAAVATVRAVTMGGFLVGGKIFHRDYDLLSSISCACIVLLIFEPLFLFNVGFQLSFAAVFGIGVLTAPVERLLAKLKFPSSTASWLNFRKSIAVSISAVSATYIVFAHHMYEIPIYSVLGNIVIMPTVTIILVLGLVVGLVGLVAMPVAALLSGAVFFILRFYEIAAVFFSNLPLAMLPTSGGSLLISAIWAGTLASFAFAFHAFGKEFKQRIFLFFALAATLIIVIHMHENPATLQTTQLKSTWNYEPTFTVKRHRSDTLIIGAPSHNETALLRYLDKRNVRQAALLLTTPPHPRDVTRLAEILPRIHTLYLPAHPDGVTLSLMNQALTQLALPPHIVFLNHGDTRSAHGTQIQVFALPMGELEVVW
jgi:competence protein ComEC